MNNAKRVSLLFLLTFLSTAFAKPQGFVGDIDELTVSNTKFRKVIYTAKQLQLVLMSLKPGEEIGEEVHQNNDQFFRFEGGRGKVVINGKETSIKEDDAVLIPAGASHNIINTGKKPLQFYTLYAPPEHKDKTVHATKSDETEEHFDGKTTE
jgi:mannose-6-phosphate isomerase-like protein (cupin superfamily)